MAKLPQMVPLRHDRREPVAGRIRRAVVDIDDLVGPAAIERGGDLLDQGRDVVGFVAHGNDDGNRRLGRRQIESSWLELACRGNRRPGRSRFYGAEAPRATLLRRPETGSGRATTVPSAWMAKPRLRAANQ